MRNAVPPAPAPAPTKRRTGRRLLVTVLGVVLVLVLVVIGGVTYLVYSVGNGVPRISGAFAGIGDRPASSGGTTFLLVGTDSRAEEATTGADAAPGVDPGSQRSDVIMLGTIAPDGQNAGVVSIPRDSWVDIPGRGKNKINAAYAFGGAPLLIRTVEQLTGVRIDHFGVVDFAGFTSLVDSVDGIDVTVAQATSNAGVEFRQGENHLDGAQALAYVRQRHGLPHGDLDRVVRQQYAIKALLEKVQEKATTDPAALYSFATSVGDAVSVDDSLSNTGLVRLAVGARNLRSSDVGFVTAPVAGLGREGAQSVVYLDEQRDRQLWNAVRTGSVKQYAGREPSAGLSGTPS